MELGDITQISRETLEALAKCIGTDVGLIQVGGGSPCQDLSALLADREGLWGPRSRLFFEKPSIFNDLREVFKCPVHTFVENVFSMTKSNREEFSAQLGVEPVLLDTCHFSGCRRPRPFWVDWPIEARQGETLLQHDGYREWVIPAGLPQDNWWVDKGCKRLGSGPLPAPARALPGKFPPKQPAGLATATREAIECWSADNHRFQGYQYEQQHLLSRPDGTWRLPSFIEREKVMGFPLGYMSNGQNPKLTMDAVFNLGASMIGNSFNVYAMTFLLDEPLSHRSPGHQPWCLASMPHAL